MSYRFIFVVFIITFRSCSNQPKQKEESPINIDAYEDYQLYQATDLEAPLLILFPGMGRTGKDIQAGLKLIPEDQISVLYMDFGNKLVLTEKDNIGLESKVSGILLKHELKPSQIVIGGFSAGGLVTVYWSNYLLETDSELAPNKAFVVDSPLDLQDLYYHVTDVDSNSNPISIQESDYVQAYFADIFQSTDSLSEKIADISPFCLNDSNAQNMIGLSKIPLRIYTEPDAEWWMENRNIEYEATNAFQLESIYNMVQTQGWDKIELIKTKDKGYRANGERHPHSWSIVDSKELIEWVAKD